MITLHVFNPEHDIALASHLEHFTAPHAGRQLRHDLGFLPALWAGAGEYVLVEDKDAAIEGLRRLGISTDAELIDAYDLEDFLDDGKTASKVKVLPWGWDIALRHDLIIKGVGANSLPSNAWLNTVRLMSHRAWASTHVLKPLREIVGTVGESHEAKSLQNVKTLLAKLHRIVLKAPWSSSGRGIRYVADNEINNGAYKSNASTYFGLTPQLEGWINNVILRQGSVMVEPYYNKVCDFGMEFFSKGDGEIVYKGLSVFQTANGAYTGNVLDDEQTKQAMICRYLPQQLLSSLASRIKTILSSALGNAYTGPFGIDMMVVREEEKLLLHPCVELNLRMTMGYVANLLTDKYQFEGKVMRIIYNGGCYRMRIEG